MSQATKQIVTKSLSGLKLNEDLLRELCDIIEAESIKMPVDAYRDVRYYSHGKITDYSGSNSIDFIEKAIQKDLRYVELRLITPTREIAITLGVSGYKTQTRVSGIDYSWVNDTDIKLQGTFEKYRLPINKYIHKTPILVALSASIAALAFGAIVLGLHRYPEIAPSFNSSIGNLTLAAFSASAVLIVWLYPSIETRHMKRVRKRKAILSITSAAVAVSLSICVWLFVAN